MLKLAEIVLTCRGCLIWGPSLEQNLYTCDYTLLCIPRPWPLHAQAGQRGFVQGWDLGTCSHL